MMSELRQLAHSARFGNSSGKGNGTLKLTCDAEEALTVIDHCLFDALGEVGTFILDSTLEEVGVSDNTLKQPKVGELLHDIEETLRPVFGELNTLQLMRHIRSQLFAA